VSGVSLDLGQDDNFPGAGDDTDALPSMGSIPARAQNGSVSSIGATVEGDGDESVLSASETTENTELTSTDTERSLTRSGVSYSTRSTACSTATELCERRKRQLEALQQRAAKSRRLTLSVDLTQVSAMKATHENQTTTVMLQFGAGGRYIEASRAQISSLRSMGHGNALDTVCSEAIEKGEARTSIQVGAKSEDELEHPALVSLGSLPMTAIGMYCSVDCLDGMIFDTSPQWWYPGHGELLRSYTNDDGKTTFNSLSAHLDGAKKQTHGYKLCKVKKVKGEVKDFMDHPPLRRQEIVLDLEAKGKMLLVDYHSKRNSKVTGHVVGVFKGKVYDNDEKTGGIFDLKAYVEREWGGIYMARIVVAK